MKLNKIIILILLLPVALFLIYQYSQDTDRTLSDQNKSKLNKPEEKQAPDQQPLNQQLLKEKPAPLAVTESLKIIGKGYAETRDLAEYYAREDLALSIMVTMHDNAAICKDVNSALSSECDKPEYIKKPTDIPLLGVEFRQLPAQDKEVSQQAIISPTLSLSAYQQAMDKHFNAITAKVKMLKGYTLEDSQLNKNNVKDNKPVLDNTSGIENLLTEVTQYNRLAFVAAILGDKSIQKLPVDEASIRDNITRNTLPFESMNKAAEKIAKGLGNKAIFVYPPRPGEASEITPFARAFQDILKSKVNNVSDDKLAPWSLIGKYNLLDNGKIVISYELLDKQFVKNKVDIVVLDEQAQNALRVKPLAINFEKTFISSLEKTGDFRTALTTNMGSENLLFQEGERLNLMVRISHPGSYFLVGHVVKAEEEYSYLLRINDNDESPFVSYVNKTQSGRYQDLGKYIVQAPFGVEYLQVIAADIDLKKELPTYALNKSTGDYVLNNTRSNAIHGLEIVRNLVKKIKKQHVADESVIAMTMMSK